MSVQPKKSPYIFILAGTSQQYTDARRKLDLTPSQAFWLTSPVNLAGEQNPKVYRYGEWKILGKLREIEAALTELQADISDLS